MSNAPLPPTLRTGNTAFATAVALLILRMVLGWAFIFHGAQHAFGAFGGPGIAGTAGMFSHLGLPSFIPPTGWAYMAAYGEFLGGVTVLLGLLTRLGTIPILVSMFVAIGTVHGANGFGGFFDEHHVQHVGYEYNLALIGMASALLIAGPGLISFDALLFRRGFWARGAQPLSTPTARS